MSQRLVEIYFRLQFTQGIADSRVDYDITPMVGLVDVVYPEADIPYGESEKPVGYGPFAISALVAPTNAYDLQSGGRVTLTGLADLKSNIVQGRYLLHVDGSNTKRYFIEAVEVDANGAITDIIVSAGISGTDFDWDGAVVVETDSGELSVHSGQLESWVLTGGVTSPPFPNDTDGNEYVESTVTFTFDSSGVRTYGDVTT